MAKMLVVMPEGLEDMLEISQGRALEMVAAFSLVLTLVGLRTSSIPVLTTVAALAFVLTVVGLGTSSVPVSSLNRVALQDFKEAS